ncbi:MAG: hypothetical protein GXP47_15350, partial [Acidobacteria bacterium]|nr:hypothetical protein [Acidobacteriota bacterium]
GVTSSKIANGTVVRSLKGVQGNVDLVGGNGVTITPDAGNHKITFEASGGGGGLTLPYSGQGAATDSNSALFNLTNEGPGTTMSLNQGTDGRALGLWSFSGYSPGKADTSQRVARAEKAMSDWSVLTVWNEHVDGQGVYVYNAQSAEPAVNVVAKGIGVQASSDGTYGVLGKATNSSGVGVRGESPSTGVVGEATNTANVTNGVFGLANSPKGHGVYGWNMSTGSGARGIVGETEGAGGWASGVFGTASATTAIGVTGWNTSNGPGLYAWSETGNALIVKGTGTGDLAEIYDHKVGLRWKVTHAGEVYADGSFHSNGADFAEMYPADGKLDPGTVVGIGSDGKLEPATAKRARAVMGVVSDRPTIVGGSTIDVDGNSGKVAVAILGIVEVRASAASGPIHPGDLLCAGSEPGTAEKAVWAYPGTIIGKALEALPSGTGSIRMLVTLR